MIHSKKEKKKMIQLENELKQNSISNQKQILAIYHNVVEDCNKMTKQEFSDKYTKLAEDVALENTDKDTEK